ncbi:MAG: cation transporter [Gemmatimonadota bacterium]|nr:cation transporter [Gemmatimonadota bacterium]
MQQMTMEISGMTCGGCVTRVRNALGALSGTRVDAVSVGSATVTYDESQISRAAIAQAVINAGYDAVDSGALVGAAVGTGKAAPGGGCCCG